MIKKKLKARVILALGLSIGSLVLLWKYVVPQEKINIEYGKYVKAIKEINIDDKITDDMLGYEEMPLKNIPATAVRDKSEIINKYAKSNIFPGEPIVNKRIKEDGESKFGTDERLVRIYTNFQAYGGVGEGERVDLIYVTDKFSEELGSIVYEGVLVKSVLNNNGQRLSELASDKYNATDLQPVILELVVSQTMGLEIETLQSTSEGVKFKVLRWTEKSKVQETEGSVRTLNDIVHLENEQKNKDKEKKEDVIVNN